MKRISRFSIGLLAFTATLLLAKALYISYSTPHPSPFLTLLEVPSLQESDIASIRFTRLQGRNQIWETDDPGVIADVYRFLETVRFTETPGVIGQWLGIKIFLYGPVDGVELVRFNLPGDDIIEIMVTPDQYQIVSGGYSPEEWDAILGRCTLVFDTGPQ